MASFGRQLRTERERRGLARSEVAEAISIYIHDLAALEFEDFSLLPGDDGVVEGFVRTYAEFLGLDVDALVEDYRRSRPERVSPPGEGARAAAPEPGAEFEQDPGDVAEEGREIEPPAASVEPPSEEPVPVGAVADVGAGPVEDFDEAGPEIDEPAPTAEPVSPGSSPRRPIPVSRVALGAGALAVVAIVVAWSLVGGDRNPAPPVSDPAPAPVEDRTEVAPASDSTGGTTPVDDVVPAAPAGTRPPPAPPVDATLRVSEYGAGTGVVDRRLVGESDRFVAGSRVWFWTRVVGGARGARVEHVWLFEGREVDRIALDVGSANWRTHSAKRVYETGRWAVEARDPDGAVLARGEFGCVPE